MSRLGKCHNYAGCLLAYRGEQTEVPDGQPFVCAECGKPLSEVKGSMKKYVVYALVAVLVAAVVGGAVVAFPALKAAAEKRRQKLSSPGATPAAEARGKATPSNLPAAPIKQGDAEPPPRVVAEPKVNLSVDPAVKREVLKRIDLMPNISPANKDKLYNSVERARKMGLVITVPFGKGKSALAPADVNGLKEALERPDVAKLRGDPTAVLVILGYADPKGDAKANLEFSQKRADAVVNALKHDVGLLNVVHGVAMGGSTLLDGKNLEKNRIAEVWIVLP